MNVLEHRREILSAVVNYAVDYMTEKVPAERKFPPLCVRMADYAAAQIAYLYIGQSAKYGRGIRVSVNPRGTDMEISNCIFIGSKQEDIDWLKDEARISTLIKIDDRLFLQKCG